MSVRKAAETPAWTVTEAKAKLSEILRLAESEGPQWIGMRKRYVVVPEEVWLKHGPPAQVPEKLSPEGESPPQMSMGQYLLQMMPRGIYDDTPHERGSNRPIPYADWTEEEWAAFDAAEPNNR